MQALVPHSPGTKPVRYRPVKLDRRQRLVACSHALSTHYPIRQALDTRQLNCVSLHTGAAHHLSCWAVGGSLIESRGALSSGVEGLVLKF
jgi:hypothetical protein